jgi:ABC-type Fe3+/spermidine/putrescine transport system ATPase subunit
MHQPAADQRGIRLINVTKRFGHQAVVDDISFQVKEGEFMSLLGPSGCGKTTTLRLIAGFLKPNAGTILVGGVDVTHLPPYKRNIGLVFQNYALWPHMTVFENIAFGLKLKKVKPKAIKESIDKVLSLTGLTGLENRFPRELSGGQQQRVSLARVLALNPAVFLLDEPLSNLDRKLRIYMRLELRQLQKKLGMTILYVTHDQEEALSMSDRIIIIDKGKIIQVGTPDEIYERPQSIFAADFVGSVNAIQGAISDVIGNRATFRADHGLTFHVPANEGLKAGQKITITIRPEKFRISRQEMKDENVLAGQVRFVDYFGSLIKYFVEIAPEIEMVVESQNLDTRFQSGERVYLQIDPHHCYPIPSKEFAS